MPPGKRPPNQPAPPPNTPAPAPPPTPTQALGVAQGTPDQVVQQLYGSMAWALNIPEVSKILHDAAASYSAGKPWTTDQFNAAIMATKWWKTTSDSMKSWEQEISQNPGEAQQKVSNLAFQIRSALLQQGVSSLPDSVINRVATEALQFGWSNDQTRFALDSELQRSPTILTSKVGTDYKALAQQYAVPMSDATLQQWAANGVSGVTTDEQFREYLAEQAKLKFKGNDQLTRWIDGGGTVDQFMDPYKQYAAQTLGINPNSISLTDPKWSAAINARVDDKGTLGPMSYDEWVNYMRSNPVYGYANTTQAKQGVASLEQTIGQMFGKVGAAA